MRAGRSTSQNVEVFLDEPRRFGRCGRGGSLRIITNAAVSGAVWTANDWQTNELAESSQVGNHISYVDLPMENLRRGDGFFTLFWTEEHRWEGRNFDVAMEAGPDLQASA